MPLLFNRNTSSLIVVTSFGLIGLISIAATKTPGELGPFGITLWFVLLLVVIGGALSLLFFQLKKRMFKKNSEQAFPDSLRAGVLTSTWITALLALNSLRQLGVKDIVLVSILVVLVDFYLRRV